MSGPKVGDEVRDCARRLRRIGVIGAFVSDHASVRWEDGSMSLIPRRLLHERKGSKEGYFWSPKR